MHKKVARVRPLAMIHPTNCETCRILVLGTVFCTYIRASFRTSLVSIHDSVVGEGTGIATSVRVHSRVYDISYQLPNTVPELLHQSNSRHSSQATCQYGRF